MKKHIACLRYVARHKWFVFVECLALGIPWRGIIHDWSKFLPCEWTPYAEYDWTQECVDEAFDRAWLHHQHYNRHHWQYWVLRNDDGDTRILRMPDKYMREMLADWRGAGRALGFPDTYAWYMRNRNHILLHPQTQEWIEDQLQPEFQRFAA